MNCRKAQALIQDFREDRMDGDTRAAMADHFGHCPDCRSRLAQIDQADRLLRRTLQGLAPSEGFAGQVMAALDERAIKPRRSMAWLRPLLAAAAVLAVLGGGSAVLLKRGGTPTTDAAGGGSEVVEPGAIVHDRYAISTPFVAKDGRLEPYAGKTSIRVVKVSQGIPEVMVDAFSMENSKRGG